VVLVVIVFFANLACVVDPAVGVPVSIVGTWVLLLRQANQSPTLFGLVLAIGIVVDDAIVGRER
jgi:multidrug efflux pump subunit AcrB